jgi:hypothetical protein
MRREVSDLTFKSGSGLATLGEGAVGNCAESSRGFALLQQLRPLSPPVSGGAAFALCVLSHIVCRPGCRSSAQEMADQCTPEAVTRSEVENVTFTGNGGHKIIWGEE